MIVTAMQNELQLGGTVGRFIDALLDSTRRHHGYTADHSIRTARVAVAIADAMGLSDDAINEIHAAALVHDIGKLGIPRTVLHKRDELDFDEASLIRLHPVLGSSMLSSIPELRPFAAIVLHHHERYDGRGYPNALAGTDIPLASRIILAADAFDAMTSERNYRPRVAAATALAEIMMCSGQQFDPAVVMALRKVDLVPASL
jgi:putative nucleotidyltransferase with HDIG domain